MNSIDINSITTAKNVKKTITIVSTAIIVTIVSFSTTTSSSISSVTMVLAQQTDNNTTTTPTTITLSENAVQVNATEIKGYKWQINGQFNPDLRMLANTAYTFTVQNPTDSTHNLIIARLSRQRSCYQWRYPTWRWLTHTKFQNEYDKQRR
jgi:hypothetical protein